MKSALSEFIDMENNKPQSTQPDADKEVSKEAESAPEGYKVNPEYIEKYVEKKTKRAQLLLKPSVHEAISKKASDQGMSFNAYVNELLENDIKGEN